MPITATSSAALAVTGLRDLLCDSATFRQHIRSIHGSKVDPAKFIFAHDVRPPDEKTIAEIRPFAIITLAGHQYSSLMQCDATQLVASGGVLCGFFDTCREETDWDNYLSFLNFMYGTLDEMDVKFGDEFFPFTAISDIVLPERVEANRRASDDFMHGIVNFTHDRNPA